MPPDRAQQASAPTPVVADAAVSPLLPTAGEWATFAVSGAVVGALYALNSWDYPTYLVVLLAALWLGLRWAPSRVRWTALAVTVAVSVLAWAPFIVTFKPFAGGNVAELPAALRHVPVVTKILTTIGAVTGKRTTAVEFLTIFGVPYVAALALIGLGLWRTWQAAGGRRQATGDEPTPDARRLTPLVVALAVALLAAIVLSAPLVILCGVPFVAAVVLLRRQPEITPRTIALALFAFGLALILLTEFFYIQDVFQSRMNTLFKVYYQAWAMFALATALAVVLLWRAARRIPVARLAVGAGVAVALAAGLVFTALAPYAFTSHFASWQGLDGSAYLTASGNGDEVAAFAWLRQHATSKDVLLEAPGCSYEPFGEMPYDSAAAFSGVPTVIGWIGHEQQWRNGQPALYAEIGTRAQQVPSMYANPSGALAKQYGVTLLYVGRYEQQQSDPTCTFAGKGPYPVVNSPSFPGPGWTEVFHQGDVRIYRRAA